MKSKLKENKAITLIALIITIIVLLILAGIVLNLVLGENGVLRKANWSSFTTEYSQIQESSNLYYMNKKLDDYGSKSKLASQTPINTNGKNKKEYYAIKESGNRIVDFEDSLTETILEMEGITDINEAELYELDLDKINYKGKNEYIVNVKSGRVYRYEGFSYNKKIYHVPEVAIGNKEEEPQVSNLKVEGDYQFWKTSGAHVSISFDVTLPEKLSGSTITVENPTSTTAVVNGSYNTDTSQYTGTIITNENDNPNGTYTYKIKATKDGNEYIKEKVVNVNKFLDDPTIEVPEESKKWNKLTINVTNNYPEDAELSYKYYCATSGYGNAISDTATSKEITSLQPETTYNIKVEAYLNDGLTYREATTQVTTPERMTEISSIEDLEAISEDLTGNYKLTKSLDFNDRNSYKTDDKFKYYTEKDEKGNKVNSWKPLGTSSTSFKGKFDGQYYKISNLYINTTDSYQGLFGMAAGTIKKLKLENVNITGGSYTAALVGQPVDNSIIEQVGVSGKVSGSSYTAGIAGAPSTGDITNQINESFSECTIISSGERIGGIIGTTWRTEINNSYNIGEVNGYHFVGGIMGIHSSGSVNNCFSIGKITSSTAYKGGLSGSGFYGNNLASFWNTETSEVTSSGGGTSKTTTEMKTQSMYLDAGWDFNTIWEMNPDTGYPRLQWEKNIKP